MSKRSGDCERQMVNYRFLKGKPGASPKSAVS